MISILVIDDDRMNCDLLQAVLTRHGYDVHSATSGAEGLHLFRQHNPRVTILDLRMPHMDGLTVLKEIRAMDPHAPVIILGGGASEAQENQARALRVTDFVRKGLSLDVLVEGVNRVVQQPARKTEGAGPQAAPAADTGETVLVVDDEQLVLDLLVQFLTLRGYRVVGVKEGAQALAMAEQSPPDLILLDLMLPGMSGVEVLRRLREKHFSGAIIIVTGANDLLTVEEIELARPTIAAADAVVCQLEIPLELTLAALRTAREEGALTILTPAPAKEALPDELYRLTDVLCPNEGECELLTGSSAGTAGDVEARAHVLRARGARAVVLTLGERGCLVVDDDGATALPGHAVEAVDTTGAGDAFVGSLAHFLAAGDDLRSAARRANGVAAASVQRRGTQTDRPLGIRKGILQQRARRRGADAIEG